MSFRRNLPAAAETRQVQSRMLLKINERDRAIAVGRFPIPFSGPADCRESFRSHIVSDNQPIGGQHGGIGRSRRPSPVL